MKSNRIVVAIDGPAGAGKSTIARRVAGKLGFVYIDTGAMYRAVALLALRSGVSLSDPVGLAALARTAHIEFSPGGAGIFLNGEDVSEAIRTPEVSSAASKISVFPQVRRTMVERQREIAASHSVVMEGRDIGSVVFPNAEVKVFLDADPSVRTGRRVREFEQKGEAVNASQLEREIRERDERDRTRQEAPLVRTADAAYVDTTPLTIDEVEQVILKLILEKASNGKEIAR